MNFDHLSKHLPAAILNDTMHSGNTYSTAWKAYIYKGTMPSIADFETNFKSTYQASSPGQYAVTTRDAVCMIFSSSQSGDMNIYDNTTMYWDTSVTPTSESFGSPDVSNPMTWAAIFPGSSTQASNLSGATGVPYGIGGGGSFPILDTVDGNAHYNTNGDDVDPFTGQSISTNNVHSGHDHAYMLVPVSDAAGNGVIKLSTVTSTSATMVSMSITMGGI